MRTSRVHVDLPLVTGQSVTLDERAAHYVGRVLRLREGASMTLFDGRGDAFNATLQVVNRKRAEARVGAPQSGEPESPLRLELALGISRAERMDLAIQKATELGVSRIVPLQTERTVTRLDGERAERRMLHWRQVAISACEQCGRNRIPEMAPVQDYAGWLAAREPEASRLDLVLAPGASPGFGELPAPAGGVTVLIGAEGGLAPAEREAAVQAGFVAVSLGPRILRTETAAITAVALAQSLWGDI